MAPSEAQGLSRAMHSRRHMQEEFTQPSRPTSFCAPSAMTAHWWDVSQVTIDILPDDVLLDIFDRYGEDNLYFHTWWWETLVYVCRRWRNVVFASPRRLHLLLTCNGGTPTRRSLDIWPPFPSVVTCFQWDVRNEKGVDNIMAALEHRDRVSEITLDGPSFVLERFVAVMRGPFPALTHVRLSLSEWGALVLSETFLGGFSPSLRSFTLMGLVSGVTQAYFVFESACLSSPSGHPSCWVYFTRRHGHLPSWIAQSRSPFDWIPISFTHSDRTNPPPPTRVVLPTLNYFECEGDRKYLGDFVARIDTPLLDSCDISAFDDLILDIPQFH
jgi:hypothetical protein